MACMDCLLPAAVHGLHVSPPPPAPTLQNVDFRPLMWLYWPPACGRCSSSVLFSVTCRYGIYL